MEKGGLRKNSEGNYNHLFSSKWSLGKTTTIRIPEVLKDKFLELAKYLDKNQEEDIKDINLVSIFESNNQLNRNHQYKVSAECLEEYLREKGFNLEELKAARAGTKKHQLAEIHQWLMEKSK